MFISPVSDFSTSCNSHICIENKNISKNILKQKNQNVSFTGSHYPSGYYTDEEIVDAYKVLNYSEEEWEGKLNSILMDRLGFFKYVFTNTSEDRIEEVRKLRKDLQEQNKKIEAEKQKQLKIEKQKEINLKLEPTKTQFTKEFSDLVGLSSKDENIEIPNCIMIKENNIELTKNFMTWILNSNEVIPVKYSIQENKSNDDIILDLQKIVQDAKIRFSKTNKHSMLVIENFEQIAEHKDINKGIIASLKSLMCCCASKYHCSIIFTTKNPSKLDPILLVDSRVQSIISV